MAIVGVKLHDTLVEWQRDGAVPYAYDIDVFRRAASMVYWTLIPEVADWLRDQDLQPGDVRVNWTVKRRQDEQNGLSLYLPEEYAVMFKLAWGGR